MLRVSGFGIRVSGVGFRVQGVGYKGGGAGCLLLRHILIHLQFCLSHSLNGSRIW